MGQPIISNIGHVPGVIVELCTERFENTTGVIRNHKSNEKQYTETSQNTGVTSDKIRFINFMSLLK